MGLPFRILSIHDGIRGSHDLYLEFREGCVIYLYDRDASKVRVTGEFVLHSRHSGALVEHVLNSANILEFLVAIRNTIEVTPFLGLDALILGEAEERLLAHADRQ